jgi:hypothetical protein
LANQHKVQITTGAFELPHHSISVLRYGIAPSSRISSSKRSATRLSLRSLLVMAVIVGTTTVPLCQSQDASPPTAADKTVEQSQVPKRNSSTEPQGQKRLFGIMPAYGLVPAGMQPPPLTPGQKFKLASQYLNLYTLFFVAAESGFDQALDRPHEYGQGAEGYGKRYGAGFADGLTDGLFVTGVYPTILHQDPRYYRLGDGGFFHRTEYAVSRILVTRQDSGRRAFNMSEVLGSFTSSAIGVTYYPKSERDFSHVAERAGIQFAFDAGFNFLKEFYPDIQRKLFGRKHKQ